MNKENAHLYLPLVQALADGKTIQRKLSNPDTWSDSHEVDFHLLPHAYRIKPFECWVNLYPHDGISTHLTREDATYTASRVHCSVRTIRMIEAP